MKDKNIEQQLKTAVSHAAPDVLDEVLRSCDHEKGKVIYMEKRKNNSFRSFAAIAAVFVLLIAGVFIAKNINGVNSASNTLAAVVSLDVNPSIEIDVSKSEKVIEVKALNDDANEILDGMDLKGTDLDVAVNAIIGSMLKHGYLDDMANSILVSVSGVDGYDADTLQAKIAVEIEDLIDGAAVLSQNVSNADSNVTKLAEEHGITVGKATLIEEIVKSNNRHSFDELSDLTINELNLIGDKKQLKSIKVDGKASDKSYIGKDAALTAALKEAGLSKSQVKDVEIELDYEHGCMVYEVEFDCGYDEYSYDINALSGVVVSYETEIRGHEVKGGDIDDNDDDDDDDDDRYTASKPTNKVVSSSKTSSSSKASDSVKSESSSLIGKDAAKSAALKHAGVSSADVRAFSIELDRENGKQIYEIEFKCGNYEYEYEIDAASGSILQSDREIDD